MGEKKKSKRENEKKEIKEKEGNAWKRHVAKKGKWEEVSSFDIWSMAISMVG